MERGEVWWVGLPEPAGSEPGFRRPVLVVQSNSFNRSRIQTVVVATMGTNLRLADAPGNILVDPEESGLPEASVVNVSQVVTVDRRRLQTRCGQLPPGVMSLVDDGLRLALGLG